jgi:hypothetical protein
LTSGNSFSFDLYPGVDAELDAAFARNSGQDATALGATGLAGVVNQAIAQPNTASNPDRSPEIVVRAALALGASREVLALDPLYTKRQPDHLEDTVFGEIDWEQLSVSFAFMEDLGLEPEIIVTPDHLSLNNWGSIFANVGGATKNGGLYYDEAIDDNWREIGGDADSDLWTVAVIPGVAKPHLLGQPHNMDRQTADSVDAQYAALFDPSIEFAENYPSVHTYLMLQARRLQAGLPPIDSETATWLAPAFDNGTKAPYGFWRPDGGQVRLYWSVPSDQLDHIGARPAVRGL